MAEKCIVCKRPIKTGERVIATFVAADSTRYEAAIPTAHPEYIHVQHLDGPAWPIK